MLYLYIQNHSSLGALIHQAVLYTVLYTSWCALANVCKDFLLLAYFS